MSRADKVFFPSLQQEINHEDSPEPTRQRRDETAEASEVDEADDSTMNIRDATTSGPPPLDQMTKKLVRLALATEFTRQPLRRADITSKGSLIPFPTH